MPTRSPKLLASVPQKQDWQVNNGGLITLFPAGIGGELPRDRTGHHWASSVLSRALGTECPETSQSHCTFLRRPLPFPEPVCRLLVQGPVHRGAPSRGQRGLTPLPGSGHGAPPPGL